jgi:8-oxo-dGTP pyrophosphatase MutT (NUDIX family)
MPPVIPRDAATVVIARQAAHGGLEVLLLQRAERGDHNSGAWVFPGGLVDAADRADEARTFQRTALRECFEECGILLARDDSGAWPAFDAAARAELAALRREVVASAVSIEEVCRRFALRPAYDALHLFSHWLTPMGRAKRFDTRFFAALAPAGQEALHDAQETTDHVWITPAEALSARNSRRLMTPTRTTLAEIAPLDSVAAFQTWAARPRRVERILPRFALTAAGQGGVRPGDAAYDEVAKLDPDGRGDVWCELRPAVEVRLGERVTRVVGEDGGNRYFVDGAEVDGAAAPLLIAQDRIVLARDADSVPPEMRERAEWIAPPSGFLRRLGT